jgi:single-strand DNA-binding protein
MANLNKVMLLGNLTRDPDLRHTPKGTAVAELGLAVNRRTSDGNGGWTDETTFVDITAWGSTAENAAKYLTKGRAVFIEGRLQLDTWDDKETGQKRSKLKVVAENLQFLPDGKGQGNTRNESTTRNDAVRSDGLPVNGASVDEYDEDDIPF